MEIIETNSTVTIKNAKEGILNIIEGLPWKLFYYEVNLANTLFERTVYPTDSDLNIKDIKQIIEDSDNYEAKINIYFLKED